MADSVAPIVVGPNSRSMLRGDVQKKKKGRRLRLTLNRTKSKSSVNNSTAAKTPSVTELIAAPGEALLAKQSPLQHSSTHISESPKLKRKYGLQNSENSLKLQEGTPPKQIHRQAHVHQGSGTSQITTKKTLSALQRTPFPTVRPMTQRLKLQRKYSKMEKSKEKTRSGINKPKISFSPPKTESVVQEVQSMMPGVMNHFKANGLLQEFVSLLRLIYKKQFPMDNISLLLLLEVARWYSLPSTNQMWYTEKTTIFWRVCLKLFHGGFIRFMTGAKSTGQFLENDSQAVSLDPMDSHINFAVPSLNCLRSFVPSGNLKSVPAEVKPGIIEPCLDLMARNSDNVSHVLSMDGKKISPGLTADFGDEDLFGFEEPSLKSKMCDRKKTEKLVTETETLLQQAGSRKDKLNKIHQLLGEITSSVSSLRTLRVSKYFQLQKFKKEDDKAKYAKAISNTQYAMHKGDSVSDELISSVNDLLAAAASINKSPAFISASTVESWPLPGLLALQPVSSLERPLNLQFVQQRSDDWFAARKLVRVTGSTIFTALGLDGLKKQKEHVQKVLNPDIETAFPEDVQLRLNHGTNNEPNAVATIVGKVVPAFMPKLMFFEEGCYTIKDGNGKPFLLVSPDGSLRPKIQPNCEVLPDVTFAVEIKCPYPEEYKTRVHYTLPERYVTQVLAEMVVLDVKKLLLVSWSHKSTAVSIVNFDSDLWSDLFAEALQLYGKEVLTSPTRLSPNVKVLKQKIKDFVNTNVSVWVEVPSLSGFRSDMPLHGLPCDHLPYLLKASDQHVLQSATSIVSDLSNVKASLDSAYQLSRKKATEVVVWLLSDVDRSWKMEVPHSVPVAYALKGYSMSCEIMRNMCDVILTSCKQKNIHVAVTCFDGQWLPLANRSRQGKPLTLLQLQRDVWNSVYSKRKDDIIDLLAVKDMPVAVESVQPIAITSAYMAWVNTYLHSRQTETPAAADTQETSDWSLNYDNIMESLCSKTTARTQELWKSKTTRDLEPVLQGADTLQTLKHDELNCIIDHLPESQKVRKNMNKVDKINSICAALGKKTTLISPEKLINGPPDSLRLLCAQTLKTKRNNLQMAKLPCKEVLAAVCAKRVYSDERADFENNAPFAPGLKIEGTMQPEFWFSYPEHSVERDQLEPKCVDSHHLLVNCRAKVCKDGLPGYGISRDAWWDVSKVDQGRIISPGLVQSLFDKQRNEYARKTFSEPVESKMIELGHLREAQFCRLIRNWYRAEDEKGISSFERTEHRLAFRQFLLNGVDLTSFPAYGSHIHGMPRTMFEGFIQGMDTKLQLYAIVKGGTMNVRAIGSLQNETFFGEMSEIEPTHLGCPKAASLPRIMSTVTELLHYRYNPEYRVFSMRTARNPVYPQRKLDHVH